MAGVQDPNEMLGTTSGKENFQRLTRLLIIGARSLLKEIFDRKCPPSKFLIKLKDPSVKKQLRAAQLTKPQWYCLYPSPGVYGESADFDVTLLFRLLRTMCGLTPPTTGWDVLPAPTDHSLEADLARLKYYRNCLYAHVDQNMTIADEDFPLLWKEISNALLRIAGTISPAKNNEWRGAIDNLLKASLTAQDERNVQELTQWYQKDTEVKKAIEKLQSITQEGIEELREKVQDTKNDLNEGINQVREEVKGVHDSVDEKTETIAKNVEGVEAALRETAEDTKSVIKETLDSSAKDVKKGIHQVEKEVKCVHDCVDKKTEAISKNMESLEATVLEKAEDFQQGMARLEEGVREVHGWIDGKIPNAIAEIVQDLKAVVREEANDTKKDVQETIERSTRDLEDIMDRVEKGLKDFHEKGEAIVESLHCLEARNQGTFIGTVVSYSTFV